MAYSNWGGYAYKNGIRVEDRSDAVITTDGSIEGSPGIYPGFSALISGKTQEEVMKYISLPMAHAVLGQENVYVLLYKSYPLIYVGGEKQPFKYKYPEENGDRVLSYSLDFDDTKVELVMDFEESRIFARVTYRNGDVWCGFSGYVVGAGWEEEGKTGECISTLNAYFEGAVDTSKPENKVNF